MSTTALLPRPPPPHPGASVPDPERREAAAVAVERRVGELCDRVLAAEAAARGTLRCLVTAQAQRYEDAVHFVYANLTRGLLHGDRARIQACLFAGCNTLEQMQSDWNTGRMDVHRNLLTATQDLRDVARLLTERFALTDRPVGDADRPPVAVATAAEEDRMVLDRVEDAVRRKRRRVEELRDARDHGTGPHADLVDALRDPAAAFGTGLSAAEHRLVSTILPECALMPDLALMRDAWHPSLCLYATDRDRRWSDPDEGPHVGTFCGVILSEFLRTKTDMQRFTFVHLMTAMGFGPPDVNINLPFVEQSFYDRVNSDPALCFIAEAHAPAVRVYRGAEWADLLDLYVAEHTGAQPDAWDGAMLHHVLSGLEARMNGPAFRGSTTDGDSGLPPTTVLGALHRLRVDERTFLDGMGEAAAVAALDDGFAAAVAAAAAGPTTTERPTVAAYVAGGVGRARAWPMALRQMAVEHVRWLVRRLRLLPRSADLPAAAGILAGMPPPPAALDLTEVGTRATAWLWRFRMRRDPDDAMDADGTPAPPETTPSATPTAPGGRGFDDADVLESELRAVVVSKLKSQASVPSLVAQVCTEMDEAGIRARVEDTYGPVTDANRTHLSAHLANMEIMVSEAFRHDRRLWNDRRRRRMGMDPLELVNDFRVAAGARHEDMFDPDDLRVRYMRAYRRFADDTILDVEADVTGFFGMRDPAMFPPDEAAAESGGF